MRCCVIGERGLTRGIPADWVVESWPAVVHAGARAYPDVRHDGCRDAHAAVWASVTGPTVVLEDDAVLDTHQLPGLLPGVDLLLLGGQPVGWEPLEGVHMVPRGALLARSHAYVASSRGASVLASYRWVRGVPWMSQPRWRDELHVSLVWPPVAGQAANTSTITGLRMPERWWDERISHVMG